MAVAVAVAKEGATWEAAAGTAPGEAVAALFLKIPVIFHVLNFHLQCSQLFSHFFYCAPKLVEEYPSVA